MKDLSIRIQLFIALSFVGSLAFNLTRMFRLSSLVSLRFLTFSDFLNESITVMLTVILLMIGAFIIFAAPILVVQKAQAGALKVAEKVEEKSHIGPWFSLPLVILVTGVFCWSVVQSALDIFYRGKPLWSVLSIWFWVYGVTLAWWLLSKALARFSFWTVFFWLAFPAVAITCGYIGYTTGTRGNPVCSVERSSGKLKAKIDILDRGVLLYLDKTQVFLPWSQIVKIECDNDTPFHPTSTDKKISPAKK